MGGTRETTTGITRRGDTGMPLSGIVKGRTKTTEKGDESPENQMITSDRYLIRLLLKLTSSRHTWTQPLTALFPPAALFRIPELEHECLMRLPRKKDPRCPEFLSAIQCIKRDCSKPEM
ncbi:hypothetical protein DUI87_07632 [Hirundo rustica rustica]|uniref:Uncharacterized protein n=1 Tax=Hirundo rustica rustica TaxID=333673 RepID=A0A3M0KRZ7_HIRRU|nr:hypothetical protein DUI87_07632 [Hirundo rustica rustica]